MSTINAQTIINEVMAAHAVAPDEATSFISFRTSAKGLHRIQDCKENLQRFADLVRKNAAAFGGGIVREAKPRPAVSWPANLISLFKQSIEDNDYQAALDIGDKLGALFFIDNKGHAQMQVAPVPCDFEPRLSSVCNEDGTFAVIFPQNMTILSGFSYKAKRARQSQIDNVTKSLNARTNFNLSEALDKQSYAPVDQAATRAQWILEHGLSAEVIESRIVAHETESIEAMAAQDVSQVVAQAVATIAISEAMQASEADTELVTCEAGESESHAVTVGSVSGTTWAPVPQYVPCSPDKTGFNDGPAPAFRGDDGDTPTPPAVETVEAPAPTVAEFLPETVEVFGRHYGVVASFPESEIDRANEYMKANRDTGCIAIERGTVFVSALGDKGSSKPQDAPAPTLRGEWFAATQVNRIESKSGKWLAWFWMTSAGVIALGFSAHGQTVNLTTYATASDRMKALQALARAADAPTDTPQGGGLPCPEPVAVVEPVASVAPTPTVAVSSDSPTPTPAVSSDFEPVDCDHEAMEATYKAMRKADASASKEIAATAHAKALVDLAAQYPQLKRAETTYAGGKLAAVNMRVLLKEAFKGVKFSVTSDYNSVRVNWTDGPSDKQVNEVIGRFDIGASDSQSDYFYTVSTAFSQLFGGVQYLFTRREVSDSLVQVAIDRLYSDRSEKPTVTDYRKCTGIFDWNSQDYENRRMREMLETLGK